MASVFDIFELPKPMIPTEQAPSMVKTLYSNCPPCATFGREEGARIQRQFAKFHDVFGVQYIRGLDLADGNAHNKPSPMVSLEAKAPAVKKSGLLHKYLARPHS